MDQYHIFCDLKDSRRDLDFAAAVDEWLGALQGQRLIRSYRLSRRKLGLGSEALREFHILIETEDLDQLDRAFRAAARRTGEEERLHARVYAMVDRPHFSLYRDFPDPVRGTDATPSPREPPHA